MNLYSTSFVYDNLGKRKVDEKEASENQFFWKKWEKWWDA